MRSLFLTMGFVIMLTIVIGFDLGSSASFGVFPGSPQAQVAFMSRTDAMAKGFEGQIQETVGKITDDPQQEMAGKAKQVEGQLINSANDLRDDIDFQKRSEDIQKAIEDKTDNLIHD
jgi:uncharacterized protein YjbJ (UPF0337 family)